MKYTFVLVALAACFVALSAQGYSDNFYVAFDTGNITIVERVQGNNEKSEASVRLPATLKPIHYLVRLQPFINGNFSVNGYVEITFEVKENTDKIVLHLTDIITKNDTVKVFPMNNPSQMISILSQQYDHEQEIYCAKLNEGLKQGETYILAMNFEGFLNDNMVGFYRSSYKKDDGTTKFLATTQFQPTDARRAFPCFDEPAFKAKFSIQIIREKDMNSISNMPLIDSVPVEGQEGWFLDRFNTTLPMSTYLVAFIVSDFDYVEAKETDTYDFRVYARKNAISQAKYAVDLGYKVSKYFEDFFNVSFPLPKQDMAGVPDFSSGAMENWGLVIYRESAILYDPKVATVNDKFGIASVIAHELAHQWFGDLVTPVWWTDLWLNEGFASYMEYVGLRDVEKEMHPMDRILVTDLHEAFTLDALESSHPVSVPVSDPRDISSLFDSISYSKGASIIRMMSSFLTEKTFQKGLSNYLTEFSYSNAEQDDLWRHLTEQAHTDGTLDNSVSVKDIMDTWTLQMGYPVVTVKRSKDGTATLTQERFLLTKSIRATGDFHDYKWWIPITFTTQSEAAFNDTIPKIWMTPTNSLKVIQGMPTDDEWVIFNVGMFGFYRVNYDAANWDAIIKQLKEDPMVFPVASRVQIIDDAANLARIGMVPYDSFLDLMTYLKKETDFIPLKAAVNNLAYIQDMLSSTPAYGLIKNYMTSLILPLYDTIKFADSSSDPHMEQLKRVEILKWACKLDHEPCIQSSVDLFDRWIENPEDNSIIAPNLKPVVYCTAIRNSEEAIWNFAWQKYENNTIATEEKELLEALACSQEVWILADFLNRSLTPNQGIRKQMVRYILPAIAQTPTGRFVTWQFLRNRWDDIISYFGNQNFFYDIIIKGVTQALNTPIQMEEMNVFRAKYRGKFMSGQRAVQQAQENLQSNVEWMDKNYDTIWQWLKNNGYESELGN